MPSLKLGNDCGAAIVRILDSFLILFRLPSSIKDKVEWLGKMEILFSIENIVIFVV